MTMIVKKSYCNTSTTKLSESMPEEKAKDIEINKEPQFTIIKTKELDKNDISVEELKNAEKLAKEVEHDNATVKFFLAY